jgi:hypothetical protein
MKYVLTAALAALALAPVASAQPRAGGPCPTGALTKLPDGGVLTCSGGTWTPYDGPYPSSDIWVSDAAGISLHGQGLRNPEIVSGQWTATPLDPAAACAATQSAVVAAGEVGPEQTTAGLPGQPLEVTVLPVVFRITLSGDCVWQKR